MVVTCPGLLLEIEGGTVNTVTSFGGDIWSKSCHAGTCLVLTFPADEIVAEERGNVACQPLSQLPEQDGEQTWWSSGPA